MIGTFIPQNTKCNLKCFVVAPIIDYQLLKIEVRMVTANPAASRSDYLNQPALNGLQVLCVQLDNGFLVER